MHFHWPTLHSCRSVGHKVIDRSLINLFSPDSTRDQLFPLMTYTGHLLIILRLLLLLWLLDFRPGLSWAQQLVDRQVNHSRARTFGIPRCKATRDYTRIDICELISCDGDLWSGPVVHHTCWPGFHRHYYYCCCIRNATRSWRDRRVIFGLYWNGFDEWNGWNSAIDDQSAVGDYSMFSVDLRAIPSDKRGIIRMCSLDGGGDGSHLIWAKRN